MDGPEPPFSQVFRTLKGHRRFFSSEDDQRLRRLKSDCPSLPWAQMAELMPGFSPRQLRERWCNYLSPSLKTSGWMEDEDRELLRLYTELGPRWCVIRGRMGN
jgi:glycerophosphoryl diester phosphodiesterase